ncbi:MAG: DUF6350 family protein [Dermatophilaceae bacterium]
MSLLDRVRPPRLRLPQAGTDDGAPAPRWQLLAGGLAAALSSWAVLAVLGLLSWLSSPQASASLADALAVASAMWFVGSGGRVVVSGVPLEVVPLGFWALAVWFAVIALRHTMRIGHRGERGTRWRTALPREVLPIFAVGYAVPVLALGLVCLAGPARPTLMGVLGVFSVPLAALAVVLVRAQENEAPLAAGLAQPLPLWLRRGLLPGLWASAALLGAGAVVVLVALLWRFGTVVGLQQSVDAGWFGGALLLIAQVCYLPTLAVWGVAWLAGPGFQVAVGGSVTVSGAQPGLLPLVPVLGAVPSEASYPAWVMAGVLVPVAIGGFAGWRAARTWSRLASWRVKALSALTAACTAALVVGLLAVPASGAMGVDRLAAVGTSPLLVTAALVAELALGAAVVLLVDVVRLQFFD